MGTLFRIVPLMIGCCPSSKLSTASPAELLKIIYRDGGGGGSELQLCCLSKMHGRVVVRDIFIQEIPWEMSSQHLWSPGGGDDVCLPDSIPWALMK